MEKVILFSLTPRAGEMNHRYLVPSGRDWPDAKLAKWVRISSGMESIGTDFVYVKHVVDQIGGRKGEEFLFVCGARIKNLSPETKIKIKNFLEKKLASMDALVVKTDWHKKKDSLVVSLDEMREWETEVDNIIATAPQQTPRPNPWKLLIGIIMLIITCLSFYLFGLNQYIPDIIKNILPDNPFNQFQPDTDIVEIQNALGIKSPDGVKNQDKEITAIAVKLKELFSSPDEIGITKNTEAKEKIATYLNAIYSNYHKKKVAKKDLKDLAKDQKLMEVLTKLFSDPNHEFNSIGLLKIPEAPASPDIENPIKGLAKTKIIPLNSTDSIFLLGSDSYISPKEMHDLFIHFTKLSESVKSLKGNLANTNYHPFIESLHACKLEFSPHFRFQLFYNEDDKKLLNSIQILFENKWFNNLSTKGIKLTDLRAKLKKFGEQDNKGGTITFSEKHIDGTSKDVLELDDNDKVFLRLLKETVKACAKLK